MTFGSARSRTNDESSTVSVTNTSPKISKSLHPGGARGRADLRHPDLEERAVDVLRRVDAEAVDLELPDPARRRPRASPCTTNGCSVKRSSSPKKSPCSKQAGEQLPKSMSPRLWYRVTSFSQAGRFEAPVLPGARSAVAAGSAAERHGNRLPPA